MKRTAITALALCAGLGFQPALASTVTVPDDIPTVQQAIASGADTVLVREGTYDEVPVVERDLVLRGIGVSRRPQLSGLQLTNLNTHLAGTFVSGFDVSGTVGYTQVRSRSIGISFSDCSMDGGIQTNAYNYNCGLSLVRCRLASASSGDRYSGKGVGSITMEADTLDGGVSWIVWSRSSVSIQHCWFRGTLPGSRTGPAIQLFYEPDGPVSHNRIENYGIGISATSVEGPLTLEGNTISGCGTGMELSGVMGFVLTGNDIRNCNTGVSVSGSDALRLVGNTIIGASNAGVVAYPWSSFDAERNVIGDCGAGFLVEWDPWAYSGLLRGNTIFNCAGSAMELSWTPAVPYYSVSVENNIGFGCGAWGLSVSGTQFLHGCNDWYGNRSGTVSGVPPAATDLSVDPMFCNVAGADVRLNSASPLLDATGCGQIGALGVGCGVTATLVQRFAAARASGGIRVVWEVAEGATASAIWVERAEGADGQAWTEPVMERSIEGRMVVELDRSALRDRAYRYRLVARDGGHVAVLDPGIVVEAQARLAFGLVEVGPSPGSGPLRIAFSLAHAAAIEIDVFDVQGRRVASPGRGAWPVGTHTVEWNGLARDGEPVPAGVYIVRYTFPGGQDRRGIVRIR